MTSIYIAVLHKDKGSDYGVTFPEVPGCFSAGGSLDEAAAMAAEALALHLEGLAEDRADWPEPKGLAWVQAQPESADAVAFLAVPGPAKPGKLMRVNITLDSNVLVQIDRAASAKGMTRSAFLAQAGLSQVAPSPTPGLAGKVSRKRKSA